MSGLLPASEKSVHHSLLLDFSYETDKERKKIKDTIRMMFLFLALSEAACVQSALCYNMYLVRLCDRD